VSKAFDLVPHSLVLQKLRVLDFCWLCKLVSQLSIQTEILGPCFWYSFLTFEVLSGVPHGSVLWSQLFILFINGLCHADAHSKYLLFADDTKFYRLIKSPEDCSLLESGIKSVQGWCTASYTKVSISKTKVISFSRKTNILIHDYKFRHISVSRSASVKDLGLFIYIKFHFHNHFNHIFSHCIKLLCLVHLLTSWMYEYAQIIREGWKLCANRGPVCTMDNFQCGGEYCFVGSVILRVRCLPLIRRHKSLLIWSVPYGELV
jgi:hypothetical protein